MKFIACLVAALLMSATVLGQTKDPSFPASGTVINAAPVIQLRDERNTSLLLLPAGTQVQIVGREGPWYRVLFPSPQGEQTGLMAPYDIRIDPNAVPPSDTSDGRPFSERGFVEGQGFWFPRTAPNDDTQSVADGLVREEIFIRPARWLRFSLGADLRGSSHGHVEDEWRVDFEDRGVLRPRVAVRRLSASLTSSHVTLDLGKQFIRWGRTDILSPVDRFAPRDYLNVIDTEFLPVLGARGSIHVSGETVEVVWLPKMTPSRLPLLNERWTVPPPEAAGLTLVDNGAIFPDQREQGVRWSHTGRFEMGLSYFNGVNHLADITATPDPSHGVVGLTRSYPALRTYGGEVAVPTRAFTLKGEANYFTSPTDTSDEYLLYVIEAELQKGEWLLDAGYAGEFVTATRDGASSFNAERGMARSFIGRASFTVDPRRSVEIEGAVRQNLDGLYAKGAFSQTFGRHCRLTLAAVGIAGQDDDFLGQYNRNSHVSATFRLSF